MVYVRVLLKATAILQNFFVQHNPPPSWLEEEGVDERFLNELNYLSLNMTCQQGENGLRCNQVLN